MVMVSGILVGSAGSNRQPKDDDEANESGGGDNHFEPCGQISEVQTARDSDDHEQNRPPAYGGGNGAVCIPVLQVLSEQSRLQEGGVQSGG